LSSQLVKVIDNKSIKMCAEMPQMVNLNICKKIIRAIYHFLLIFCQC